MLQQQSADGQGSDRCLNRMTNAVAALHKSDYHVAIW
jgi:hypothetical protein